MISQKGVSQAHELTIEYESSAQVRSILTDSVRKDLKKLRIQIYDNRNTWYSYGRIPGQSEGERNMPSFRIKRPVDSLPWLGGMPKLECLTLDFLGLETLPEGIEELENLKQLDIGFNFIDISNELPQLEKLQNLEELNVLGLGISSSDREKLTNTNKGLRIYYTQEHDIELAERRRKEEENAKDKTNDH